MNIKAPWIKVLLSSLVAIVAMFALTAFANAHADREPVNHFFSHSALAVGAGILLFSSRKYWPAPKTRIEIWPRRILITGLLVGAIASTFGGLIALPGALNANLKEINWLSQLHRFDQPFLAFGFLVTILGVATTLLFRAFFLLRPKSSNA